MISRQHTYENDEHSMVKYDKQVIILSSYSSCTI